MIYADYEYYCDIYKGTVDADSFCRLATRASSFLDYYTQNRAKNFAELDAVKMCCCALVDQYKFVGYYSGAPAPVTAEPATVGEYGDSEFLLAVAGKDPAKAWAVVDELMDTLAMVNSKVYNSVMQKIKRV